MNTARKHNSPSVLRTLGKAFSEACQIVSTGFAEGSEHPERVPGIVQNGRFLRALTLFLDLRAWLKWDVPRRPKMSPKKYIEFANYMIRIGVDPQWANTLAAVGPRRGAPIRKRKAAVLAWELQLTCPEMTWDTIAQRLCDCGQAHHDFNCRERLRREVGHLKRLLNKHHITLI